MQSFASSTPSKVREVTDAQRTLLIEKLTSMAKNIATQSSSPTSVISANALMQFGSEQLHQVVDKFLVRLHGEYNILVKLCGNTT